MAEAWTCLDCGFRAVHRRGSPAAYYHAVGHQKLTQHQMQGLIDDKGTVLVEGLDQEAARAAGYLPGRKGAVAAAPAPAASLPPAEGADPDPAPSPSPPPDPSPAPSPGPAAEPAPMEAPMPLPTSPTQDPLAEPLAGADDEGEGTAQGQGGEDAQAPGGYADPFAVDPAGGGAWGNGGGGGVLSPGGGAPPPPFNPDQAAGAKPPIEGSIPFIRFTPDFMCYLCFYCDLEENPELYKGLSTEDALATYVNACCVADLMRKAHEASKHKGIVGAIGKSLAFLQQQQGALFIEEMYHDCMQQVLADLVQRGTIPVDVALQQGLRPPSAPVGGLG